MEIFLPELLSNFWLPEGTIAIERKDLGASACPIPISPLEPHSNSLMRFICIERRSVGIERKNSGQCDWDAGMFEYIQIKTILNLRFEIVLNDI